MSSEGLSPVFNPSPQRRSMALVTIALMAAAPLTACSKSKDTSTEASSSTTVTTPATSVTTASGPALAAVSADLRPLARAIYAGGAVPATANAAKAVKSFQRTGKAQPVVSTVSAWKGTPIASLTSGDDTTLAVKSGGTWKVVGGWWPSLKVSRPVLTGKQHVLFLGSDARTQKGQKVDRSNSDAIQVVGVDGKGGAGVMGIARDSWVPIAGGGMGKINSGLAKGGPNGAIKTISRATGLPIRSYVLTGFNDFIWTINAMGKVQINSSVPVKTQGGFVPKGKSTLPGLKALWYSRERHRLPNGDFGRSYNQGTVLLGIASQTRAKGPSKLIKVLGQSSPKMRSNLTAEQALLLGAWVYKVQPKAVGHKVAKGPTGTSSGGASIVRLGPEAQGIFADFKDGDL